MVSGGVVDLGLAFGGREPTPVGHVDVAGRVHRHRSWLWRFRGREAVDRRPILFVDRYRAEEAGHVDVAVGGVDRDPRREGNPGDVAQVGTGGAVFLDDPVGQVRSI